MRANHSVPQKKLNGVCSRAQDRIMSKSYTTEVSFCVMATMSVVSEACGNGTVIVEYPRNFTSNVAWLEPEGGEHRQKEKRPSRSDTPETGALTLSVDVNTAKGMDPCVLLSMITPSTPSAFPGTCPFASGAVQQRIIMDNVLFSSIAPLTASPPRHPPWRDRSCWPCLRSPAPRAIAGGSRTDRASSAPP